LIGQPELLVMVNSIPQLQQRLGIKYHLSGLDKNEMETYIKHRLSVAGAKNEIFNKEAFEVIYNYSEGLPRKINNVCDMCLLIGFGQEAKIIDRQLSERVIKDLNMEPSIYAKNV